MNQETRDKYMKRLDQEMREYTASLARYSPMEILDNVGEIHNMKHAYDYLRSGDIPEDELVYVMQAREPIHLVADAKTSVEDVSYIENPVAATVYEIYDKQRIDDGDIELYAGRIPIRFHRKMLDLNELMEQSRSLPDHKFKVTAVIQVNARDFNHFTSYFFEDQWPFMKKHKGSMHVDSDGCWNCILVHDTENGRGVLVQSEGYEYARYTAYVENTRELDLTGVPVEVFPVPARAKSRKPKQPER